MREIKFRAWDTNDGEMHDVKEIVLIPPKGYEQCIRVGDSPFVDDGVIPLSEVRLMQYTGLHDKNGREVYEGDIFDDKNGGYLVVKYSNVAAAFMLIQYNHRGNNLERIKWYFLNEWHVDDMKIIGNIHNNPELLGVGNDV